MQEFYCFHKPHDLIDSPATQYQIEHQRPNFIAAFAQKEIASIARLAAA